MNQVAPGFLSLSPSTPTNHPLCLPPFDTTVATSTFVSRDAHNTGKGKTFLLLVATRCPHSSLSPLLSVFDLPLLYDSSSLFAAITFCREWCLQFVDDWVQINREHWLDSNSIPFYIFITPRGLCFVYHTHSDSKNYTIILEYCSSIIQFVKDFFAIHCKIILNTFSNST